MSEIGLLKAMKMRRKGAWTNDPADSNYLKHWVSRRPSDRPVDTVLRGTMQPMAGGSKQFVNVVVSGDKAYVDVPAVEAIGPIAQLAKRRLRSQGLDQPTVLSRTPAAQASLTHLKRPVTLAPRESPFKVYVRRPPHIGSTANLPPGEQAQVAWRWATG